MNAISRGLTLALLGCLAAPVAAHAQKQPANLPDELDRIHILMVIDSASNLRESVLVDKKRQLTMWERTIPESRRTIKVLEGSKVTQEEIFAYYDKLEVGPNEGLVFTYAGHGVNHKDTKKHFFYLANQDLVARDDLVKKMKAKRAPLVVLLTDCCSTPQKFAAPKVAGLPVPEQKGKIQPTVRCLFFQSRGTVNVTAATEGPSWGDKDNGGVFTRSLCQLLYWQIDQLDENKDGFVDWQEFFDKLKPQTKTGFDSWRGHILRRAPKDKLKTDRELIDLAKKDTLQVPMAHEKLPSRQAKGWLLVSVLNNLDDTLHYEYRWPGKDWTAETLEPGMRALHKHPHILGAGKTPRLEIREKGRKESEFVDPEWWEGEGKPKPQVYKKNHPFPNKK